MNRKKFLFASTMTVIGWSTFGSVVKLDDNKFTGDCETTDDILGPFYRPNAPIRNDLTYDGLRGSRIEIKGIVYGSDCETPLKNALVEIWHANANGEYDNDSSLYRQRASLMTNEKGEYSFLTIIPGKYLNGDLFRPSHVHFRVTEKKSKELISQIYFKDDPHINKDPWASKLKAKERILPLILEDTKGNIVVNFNIYLKKK